MPALIVLIILQILALIVLVFGDIGFDKPGRYGFDFDDLLLFTAVYLGLLLSGSVYAVRTRRWKMMAVQILIPVAVYLATEVAPTMRAPLNPANFQHLVGMTRAEVHEQLGNRRHISGAGANESGEWECESYDGMKVFYSVDKTRRRPNESRVLSVKSNHEFDPN